MVSIQKIAPTTYKSTALPSHSMMGPSSISQLRADAEFLQQTTLLSSSVADVPNESMATLQVTNKFHLEVQHLLQQKRLYPWRRKRANHDDEIAMMHWWNSVREFVQSHITDVLQEDGIRVLPFASKEYPPLSMLSHKSMIPIVPLIVILPLSTVCTHKNDYKYERYFEVCRLLTATLFLLFGRHNLTPFPMS
jgi:hypothetical protein